MDVVSRQTDMGRDHELRQMHQLAGACGPARCVRLPIWLFVDSGSFTNGPRKELEQCF
jgi:hypothetical protein